MQDLSTRYPLSLTAGCSMAAGNTVSESHPALAMTAIGSESINPIPTNTDNVVPVLPPRMARTVIVSGG
jgi:hypothetical protein